MKVEKDWFDIQILYSLWYCYFKRITVNFSTILLKTIINLIFLEISEIHSSLNFLF